MWANAIMMILNVLPTLIHAAEQLHPQPGSGPSKLSTVLDTATTMVKHIPELADDAQKLKDHLAPIVSNVVALFNAFGHFGRGDVANVDAGELVTRAVTIADQVAGVRGAVGTVLDQVTSLSHQVHAEIAELKRPDGSLAAIPSGNAEDTPTGTLPLSGPDLEHEGNATNGGTFSGSRGG